MKQTNYATNNSVNGDILPTQSPPNMYCATNVRASSIIISVCVITVAFGMIFLVVDYNAVIFTKTYLGVWYIVKLAVLSALIMQNIYNIHFEYKTYTNYINYGGHCFTNHVSVALTISFIITFVWGWVIYYYSLHMKIPAHIWAWFTLLLYADTIVLICICCCVPIVMLIRH